VRKEIAFVGLCCALWAPNAIAADWSAKVQFRESAEANDNRALRNNSPGETYEFASEVFMSTVARLPGMRIEANADLSYRALTGPGADDFATPLNNGASIRIEKLDSLTKYYLTGSWRLQDAVSAQVADTGVVVAKGDISTYTLDAGLQRRVSPLDSIAWSVRGTSVDVDFTVLGAVPYVGLTTTGAWIRRLNPTTDLTTSVEFEFMDRDAPGNPQTIFMRAMVGVDSQLTRRLTLKAAAGAGAHRTDVDDALNPQVIETSASWLGDLQLIYRPLAGTQLSVFAAHSIAPNVVGDVQNRTSAGVRVRQEINRSSDLLLYGAFDHAKSLDGVDFGTADYFRASVTYGYRLTPDWRAELSYRFAHRTDDAGDASSNAIFLSAVRDWTLLP
jgi:hypothetical protein